METLEQNKKILFQTLAVFAVILSIFFLVKIFGEIKAVSLLGGSTEPATISFSGHGEVSAVPDIANVYFTISKDAKTAKEAQDGVAEMEKKALDFLEEKGIAEKDIKTTDASVYPKYEYQQSICPQPAMERSVDGAVSSPAYYCPPGKQVLTGYTASESITVKIRKVDDAGAVMQGLGLAGVSNLSGPNFAIDEEDELKAQARKLAIDEAKAKAEALAKDLGVRLVKIVSFSESGNNYPMMYAADAAMARSMQEKAPAPAELPKGENTISSDVLITYEIR